MNGKIIKSFICNGHEVQLIHSTKQNCYIIEVNKKTIKTFPVTTNIKLMEDFAIQSLLKLTDKNTK